MVSDQLNYINDFDPPEFFKPTYEQRCELYIDLRGELLALERSLMIFYKLLGAPQCKLLNILDKVCAMFYTDVADAAIHIFLKYD